MLAPGEARRTITESEAREMLRLDIRWVEHCIDTLVRVPLTTNQYDALARLIFNIGAPRFARSVLLSRINAFNSAGIRKEWSEFRIGHVVVSAPGVVPVRREPRVLPVLVARRRRELAMFFS
jgi:GH24 family phage-related lysozyme (muramidase)